MAAFIDVLLRGMELSSQAVAVGGVFFAALVIRPTRSETAEVVSLLGRTLWVTTVAASGPAATQGLSLLVQLGALADD